LPEPSLSIVIAAWPDLAGLADCLEALSRQRDAATECLVVATHPAPADLSARFPWIVWIRSEPDCLIPHLWGKGMTRARGDIIAITTAHFTPATDWIQRMRSAHARRPSWAIGGRIDPPRGRSPVSWAIYFLRYSTYLGYQQEQTVPDVAGDNASYKRLALVAFPSFLRDGFWEQELHRRLWLEGKGPVFDPAIRVTQCQAFRFWAFLRQRFRHGKQFGRTRAQRWKAARCLAAGLASPLIPALLLGKIVFRVLRSGRSLGPFVAGLPALCCFVLAWSAGEACGYLYAARPGKAQSPPFGSDPFSTSKLPTSAEVSLCP
jgi:GT2 family glycosyltransferase